MNALSPFSPRRFGRLIVSDAMNISRDPMLVFAVVLSLAPAAAFALWRDALNSEALAAFGVEDFARYVAPIALLLPAALVGWVTGFLLLEDRDDGSLLAIDVTPLGKSGFVAYRVTVTALVVIGVSLFSARLIVPQIALGTAVALAVLVAGYAVLAAVVLPAVARNKVEGLALTKLTNIASIVPLVAIIPSPWRYLGGLVPSFWVGELLELSTESFLPLPVVVMCAAVSHVAVGTGLLILLGRRAG